MGTIYKSTEWVVRDGVVIAYEGELMDESVARARGLVTTEELTTNESDEVVEDTPAEDTPTGDTPDVVVSKMTRAELDALATERGLDPAAYKTKDELAAALA
jgi:hypothetical protein